jgi:hypothetical protein
VQFSYKWLPKSRNRMNIPIQRSQYRNMFGGMVSGGAGLSAIFQFSGCPNQEKRITIPIKRSHNRNMFLGTDSGGVGVNAVFDLVDAQINK